MVDTSKVTGRCSQYNRFWLYILFNRECKNCFLL